MAKRNLILLAVAVIVTIVIVGAAGAVLKAGDKFPDFKLKDLNAIDIEGAMKVVEGTARSMGIDITD